MEQFESLKGKVIFEIIGKVGDDELIFKTNKGDYKLFHSQD